MLDGTSDGALEISAGYVEALGRIIIAGPYPPSGSNAIVYMHLQL